jgi:TolB-like protein/Tfp pilus assembly protein PilF
MQVQAGQMFAQCRLVQQIGAGGMGVVWKALDTSLNRHVAIKILPPDLMADSEWRQRFQREAEAAAALDHPNIAVIHQVGEQDGTPFIVMQLLQGKTLRQLIRQGPLPMKQWLRVASGMAEGLAHAHKEGIIHRDLKPDNVMVTDDGQVRILDFGLAKALDRPESEGGGVRTLSGRPATAGAELTRVGQHFGTLAYMSPEQARGETMDRRSDLFSLGVLLHEMAAGEVPFSGKSEEETLQAIVAADPRPFDENATALPDDARRVLRKVLEKEPERRYQHADEIATDLRNLQRDLTSGRVPTLSGTAAPAAPTRTVPASPEQRSRLLPAAAAAGLVVSLALLGYIFIPRSSTPVTATATPALAAAAERQKIVVLPFENMGDAENEYFAAGISEEITSRLAAVKGLGVISRKSALQYAGTGKSIQQIGKELGVGYVLGGTVRWASDPQGGSRVRITPQLIHVVDDTQVWSETYDEVIDDIFQVQSEIASRVIDQTGIVLQEDQRQALEFRSTENLAAYHAYVRGLAYSRSPDDTGENYQRQVEMFQRAIDLDPDFALAHAALSRAHAGFFHFGFDRTANRQAKARAAVDRALELEPAHPKVQMVLGVYYYWCHKDYDSALAAFAVAREGMPSSAELTEFVGYIRRRQGRWQESAADLEAAFALNPLDSRLSQEIGLTYNYLRDYPRAVEYLDRSIALTPDQIDSYLHKAESLWLQQGETAAARLALEAMPASDHPAVARQWFMQLIFERNYDEAIAYLQDYPVEILRHYSYARPRSLLMAQAHALAGESALAREEYQAARVVLQREAELSPDDYRVHSALGLALAGLDLKEEAAAEGRRALEVYPLPRDAMFGVFPVLDLALIYTAIGDHDAALEQLGQLLAIPSLTTMALVELDPRFAPLRDHPRFVQLLDGQS